MNVIMFKYGTLKMRSPASRAVHPVDPDVTSIRVGRGVSSQIASWNRPPRKMACGPCVVSAIQSTELTTNRTERKGCESPPRD